jgi:hypothetical protein
MNFTSGLPDRRIVSAFTWYGRSSAIRSFQTSSGSPIDTHTSVSSTSAPRTASSMSSLIVIFAPVSVAAAFARSMISSRGHSDRGLAIRTSMPSFAPPTRYESAMLKRASPR